MSLIEELEKMPQAMIMCMSPEAWLRTAWDAAVEGIDGSSVVKTDNGFWFIQCETLETLQSLQVCGQIVARIHHIGERRKLPQLRAIVLLPPNRFCSPFSLLKEHVIQQMPEHQWLKYAYRLSVDPITAKTSMVSAIDNGVWHIRCASDHAYQVLQAPQAMMGMIHWLSQKYRPLPALCRLKLSLGQIKNEEET